MIPLVDVRCGRPLHDLQHAKLLFLGDLFVIIVILVVIILIFLLLEVIDGLDMLLLEQWPVASDLDQPTPVLFRQHHTFATIQLSKAGEILNSYAVADTDAWLHVFPNPPANLCCHVVTRGNAPLLQSRGAATLGGWRGSAALLAEPTADAVKHGGKSGGRRP